MRQRITFLQRPEDAVNPELIKVTSNAISAPQVKAARHDRITFTLDELPQELYRAIKAVQELHIRWSSDRSFEAAEPVVSRVAPGLHVCYTPEERGRSAIQQDGEQKKLRNSGEQLCPLLEEVFGKLDCSGVEFHTTKVIILVN